MDPNFQTDESNKAYQYKYLLAANSSNSNPINAGVSKALQKSKEYKHLSGEELEQAIKEKRDLSKMEKVYNPMEVEKHWYDYWKKLEVFHADEKKAKELPFEEKYIIVVPPPNITGHLHIGHALTASIEDCLVRWSRMKGLLTEYLPGTDHAGIATQSIVEKQLWKTKKLTRYDIGREEFMQEIFKWKDAHCDHILKQFEHMGSSLDWPRLAFTMDEKLSYAVQESFVRLYDRGLIYRANRLVNWSCQLRSAISDLEVEYNDIDKPIKINVPGHKGVYEFGTLTEFSYKFKDGSGEIIVATTRLETMLGDVAVAVNSKDERYKNIVGKELVHPFIKDRKMVVIVDDILVDMSFGTGAVKITPAHDPNDFDCGMRNKLEFINIIAEDGKINENGGQFAGMMRFDARMKVEEELRKMGQVKGKKPNPMRLGFCQRSKDVIEPILKPQWWMDCQDIAKKMIDVVKTKQLEIIPEDYVKNWNYWLENIKDWCISRQLWWGHRIPAYMVCKKGEEKPNGESNKDWVIARNHEEAVQKAMEKFQLKQDEFELVQDEDVLDTWYSSALFPFSPFFWPDTNHDDYKAFYPNTILETGHDILFFWVARMVMFGLLLTDQIPFKYVYLHPIIRDAYGKKMSKSKGNVIDPLEIIEGTTLDSLLEKILNGNLDDKELQNAIKLKKQEFPEGIPECGTDALRFGLLAYLQQAGSLNLDVKRIIGWRTFCNKIWQSYKFAISKFATDFKYDTKVIQDYDQLLFLNKWVLAALNRAVVKVNAALTAYEFAEATTGFHAFWLYEFCDVYIEGTKNIFKTGSQKEINETLTVLFTVLETGMRLLHPMMPYISEELYQKLPEFEGKSKTLVIAPYPKENQAWNKPEILQQFSELFNIVKVLRKLYSSINLPNNVKPKAFFIQLDENKTELKNLILNNKELVCTLSGTSEFQIGTSKEITIPKGCITGVVGTNLQLYAEVKQYLNIESEIARLNKNIEKNEGLLKSYHKKMAIPNYKDKVPKNVQELNQANLNKSLIEKEKLEESLKLYKSFLEN